MNGNEKTTLENNSKKKKFNGVYFTVELAASVWTNVFLKTRFVQRQMFASSILG